MYTITVTIKNPMTGRVAQLVRQFDENTLDQNKWNSAFPAVNDQLQQLKADSAQGGAAPEPVVW